MEESTAASLVSMIEASIKACNWKSAIFYSQTLLGIDENSVDAAFGLALSFYSRNKLPELEQFLESVPLSVQKNESILTIRCMGLEKTKEYEKICALVGGDPERLVTPLIPLSDIDKFPKLKAMRENALFNTSRSEERAALPQHSGTDPMNPDIMTQSIAKAMQTRDARLVEVFTHKTDKTTKNDALVLTACGCHCWLTGRGEEADSLFLKAIDEDPDLEIAWLCLLASFIENSAWDQGLSTFRQVIRRFPESDAVSMFAMNLHLKSGSSGLAWPWISRCDIDHPFVRHERGVAFLMEKDYQGASKDFTAVLETATEDDLKCSALINLGHCYRHMRRFNEAIEQYENAMVFGINHDEALAAIGFTHHLQGNIDTAILFYNRCLAINPTHAFGTKMLDVAIQSVNY